MSERRCWPETSELAPVDVRIDIGDRTFSTYRKLEVSPLTYEQLINFYRSGENAIGVPVHGAERVSGRLAGQQEESRHVAINVEIETDFQDRVFGLVPGGWLPMGFMALDGNTLNYIDSNLFNALPKRPNADTWTAPKNFFACSMVEVEGLALRPVFAAIEGSSKSCPSDDNVRSTLARMKRTLRRSLPKGSHIADSVEEEEAVELVAAARDEIERVIGFLREIAPDLEKQVTGDLRNKLWDKVVRCAAVHALERHHLAVIACLSDVAPAAKSSLHLNNPGRRVIKPSDPYDEQKAFNAAPDLMALKLFLHVVAVANPQRNVQFCTKDIGLAMLWAGIAPSLIRGIEHDPMRCGFRLNPEPGHIDPVMHRRWQRDVLQVE